MGVSSLLKTVTRQRRDCDLNLGSSAPESSTLTTRLQSHPISIIPPKNATFPVWDSRPKLTGMVPWAPWNPHLKLHLDWFSRFAMLTLVTNKRITRVAIGRILCTVMRFKLTHHIQANVFLPYCFILYHCSSCICLLYLFYWHISGFCPLPPMFK